MQVIVSLPLHAAGLLEALWRPEHDRAAKECSDEEWKAEVSEMHCK